MISRRHLKHISLLVVVLLIGYLLGYVTVPKQKVVIKKEFIPSNRYMLPVLEIVVRDAQGNIIKKVTKVGDPPVKNFPVLLMLTFCHDAPQQLLNNTTIDIGGATTTISAGHTHATRSGVSQIVIGNAVNPQFQIDKYKLDSEVARFDIQTAGAFYNNTHMWVLFRAQWTNSGNDINITEVGLIWRQYTYGVNAYGYEAGKDFLVFYDVINPPITVPSGGSITISYYIYIRYA